MELAKTGPTAAPTAVSSVPGKNGRPERSRKRWGMTTANVRFFLLKPGSSADKPELGREIASENEALVEAFRTGQTFFTVIAWKAVPDLDGEYGPKIVKQALPRT